MLILYLRSLVDCSCHHNALIHALSTRGRNCGRDCIALVVLSKKKIPFCEEIHGCMRGAQFRGELEFAHTSSGGVYAFVQGELLCLLCCALVACSFVTDGVEPFCLPCEESAACELCLSE